MAVRERGDWEGWIAFFLDGVRESADTAANTAARVQELREADRRAVSAAGGGAHDLRLIDALYAQPLVNASWVVDHIGVAPTTANKMLERFAQVGILRETTGKKRYRIYRYDTYVELFEGSARPGSVADETLS